MMEREEPWNVESGPGSFLMTWLMLTSAALVVAILLKTLRGGE